MLRTTKFFKVAAATAVSASVLTVAAFAYSGPGTVKVSTDLNVRASDSTSSKIIGKLYNGNKLSITGSANGWYKISYNGSTGWVSSDYVTVTSPASSVSSRQQTVVNAAESELGVQYVFDGASPSTGFDCSGLTMYAYSKIGITLPHYTQSQAAMGTAVSRSSLEPGDIIFFDTDGNGSINHAGIYIGNGDFIDAQSGAGKVMEQSLSTDYWSNAYMTARRYIY